MKTVNKLTVRKIEALTEKGWYPDGHGLYLQISSTGSKSWVYRYQTNGRQHWHGLGTYTRLNSLIQARNAAAQCKQLRKDGIDPIQYQRSKVVNPHGSVTFKDCAEQYITSQMAGWKNSKHIQQWRNSLNNHAYPVIGSIPVQDIDIAMVLKILEPIWATKTETASRVRQRIESTLDWATIREYRTGANPAQWKGRLDKILPSQHKVQKPKHFAAMKYQELPDYFWSLRQKETVASKALAFTILTATRNSETRAATYSEVDQSNSVWIISDIRMKAGKEHRIPLTTEPQKIIEEMKPHRRSDDYIFPGTRYGSAISDAALLKLVKNTHPALTVHGFRSTFRDWAAECTDHPREIVEAALAHSLKNKVEAAYLRSDHLEKRRKLMVSWTKYCLGD